MKLFKSRIIIGLVFLGLIGCVTEPEPEISYDPAALQFDGEQALATETKFVTQFPNRDSGQPNNRLAAEWLQTQLTELGLNCTMQEWEIINFSQPLPLNNVVCSLAGESPQGNCHFGSSRPVLRHHSGRRQRWFRHCHHAGIGEDFRYRRHTCLHAHLPLQRRRGVRHVGQRPLH